jgi:sulfite exporter TauE/SafE/copper chaperone CopZ
LFIEDGLFCIWFFLFFLIIFFLFMSHLIVPIRGMHCASCEILIGDELRKVTGVVRAQVDHKRAKADVYYTDQRPSDDAIERAVRNAGYEVGLKQKLPWLSRNPKDYSDLLYAAIVLFILYLVVKQFGFFNLAVDTPGTGVAVALIVGLVAGVSTCMALIGGLVLSLATRHAERHPEATAYEKFRPHIYFNLGRILGYAFFGGIIGWLGSVFTPSTNVLGTLTMVVGGIMIFLGLKLIEIFPVLHDKGITLPSGIARFFGIKKEVREYSHKNAMVLGGMTFFLPCGFTQAMQIYAVSTGSFVKGALIMGLFALGTAAGLLGVGGLSSVFKGQKARVFSMTVGILVIILGWTNLTNGSRLLSGEIVSAKASEEEQPSGEVQEVRMTQSASGYSPNTFTVEKGRPVKWIINSTSAFTCASSLVLPKYGISKSLRPGENIITFTPTESGDATFSCSMGMFRGKFIVVDKNKKSALNTAEAKAKFLAATDTAPGSSCGASGGCGCMGSARKREERIGAVAYENGDETVQLLKTTYTLSKDIFPNTFIVERGKKVKLAVDVQENGSGCMSTIMVPGLYNSPQYLQGGTVLEMEFTPEESGDYSITCAMGVPRGVVRVVDSSI